MREHGLDRDELLSRLVVPGLTEGEVGRMVAAAMPVSVPPVSVRGGRRWTAWGSHAAAILVGMILAHAWSSGRADPAPMQVPNQEAAAALEVEKIIERIVYRDRPVENPLQPRWDAQLRLAGAAGDLSLFALAGIEEAFGDLATREMSRRASEPAAPRTLAPAGAHIRVRPNVRPHVEVLRHGDRVKLVTRGSLPEVVPVLIDTMETGDGSLAAAAFDRLQSIRAEFGDAALELRNEGDEGQRPGGVRRYFSGRARPARPAGLRDASLWRDWWARQQLASGVTLAAASI